MMRRIHPAKGLPAELITSHLSFIERQCRRSLSIGRRDHPIELENEALILCNRVLDKLKAEDYRIVRQFRGQSKFTTYLNAIISYQAVDLIRHRRGRDQKKERAGEWGSLGRRLHRRVIRDGLPVREVYRELKEEDGFKGTRRDLEQILGRIRGSGPRVGNPETGGIRTGSIHPEERDIIIPDSASDPQTRYLQEDEQKRLHELVQKMVNALSGEEQLLIRMRYLPRDPTRPLSVQQMAGMLDISPKAVYHRLHRVLKKCREFLQREGYHEKDG